MSPTPDTQHPTPRPCPLCQYEALEPQLVSETASFLLLAAHEPLAEGHLMLVPRAHLPCLAAFPASADAELLRLKERALQTLAEVRGRAAVVEQGRLEDQSAHARLDFLPGAPDLVGELGRGREAVRVDGLEQVRALARGWGGYLYWELDGARTMVADTSGGMDAALAQRLFSGAEAGGPPQLRGRAAAQAMRAVWQRRMVAAGEPIEVVTCLLRRADRVCLLLRSPELDSAPGKWHGVSGYLPEGVEPLQQALLEIEQELGLSRDQVMLVRAIPPLIFGSPAWGRMWRIHPFLFELLEGEPRLNWEHTDLAWVRPSEVGRYDCVGSTPELVRRLVGP